jgi:hypothetical protein
MFKYKQAHRHFSTKNALSLYTDLKNFKLLITKLLEEKIYHYTTLSNETKELNNLYKLSKKHLDKLDRYKKTDLCLTEKVWLFNNATILLEYTAFIELVRYLHERKEEDINNFLRDTLTLGIKHDDKLLISIRDEWRDCLLPEILDSQDNPVNPISIVSQVNMELNKYLANLII